MSLGYYPTIQPAGYKTGLCAPLHGEKTEALPFIELLLWTKPNFVKHLSDSQIYHHAIFFLLSLTNCVDISKQSSAALGYFQTIQPAGYKTGLCAHLHGEKTDAGWLRWLIDLRPVLYLGLAVGTQVRTISCQ